MPGTTARSYCLAPSTPKRSLVIALLSSRGARCAPWTASLAESGQRGGLRSGVSIHGRTCSSAAPSRNVVSSS